MRSLFGLTRAGYWGHRRLIFTGEESEPFIVAKADDVTDLFLLTITDRYLLERSLVGDLTGVLDLHCLRSIDQVDLPWYVHASFFLLDVYIFAFNQIINNYGRLNYATAC